MHNTQINYQNDSQMNQESTNQNSVPILDEENLHKNESFNETKLNIFKIPKLDGFDDYFKAIKWIILLPINIIFAYLIPDCRIERLDFIILKLNN
jgi:hypothetical protein